MTPASRWGRLGSASRSFDCCDTAFVVVAEGIRAASGAAAAERRVRELASRLNAFEPESAVAALNETGRVRDRHVAAVVRRGLEYHDRTGGVFDIRRGRFEHELKAYLRGDGDTPPAPGPAEGDLPTVAGDVVRADAPLDLNGLAKGYIVDRAAEALSGVGRRGFVSGGGDVSRPTGPVAVEDPTGGAGPLRVLDTDRNVASSGGYRRRRGEVDHVYDPRAGVAGARHDLVTVVAGRDCMEADALATTLAALPGEDALALATSWPDAEAMLVTGRSVRETPGFEAHVHERDPGPPSGAAAGAAGEAAGE